MPPSNPASSVNTTPNWTGSLKMKKKAELQQICRELEIGFKNDTLKADLEQEIQNLLKSNSELWTDARYSGLVFSSGGSGSSPPVTASSGNRTRRGRSVSRPRGEHENQNQTLSEENLQPKEPEKRALGSVRSISDRAEGAPTSREDAPKSSRPPVSQKDTARASTATASATAKTTQPIKNLTQKTSGKVVECFNAFAGCTSHSAARAVERTQTTLSSPEKLSVLAIVAELLFVLSSVTPLPGQLQFGSQDGAEQTFTQFTHILKSIFHILTSKSFLRPLVEYGFLTVLIPYLLAGLMNVPGSSPPSSSTKLSNSGNKGNNSNMKKFRLRDIQPGIFTFNATRLAILVLVHLVFKPDHHYGWVKGNFNQGLIERIGEEFGERVMGMMRSQNSDLRGFEFVQYVSTGFGLVMALHQIIVDRKH